MRTVTVHSTGLVTVVDDGAGPAEHPGHDLIEHTEYHDTDGVSRCLRMTQVRYDDSHVINRTDLD